MSESDVPARLEPVSHLAPHPEAGSWQWLSLGTDPHFSVVGPYPTGWVRIRLRARAETPGVAALYLNLGNGFGQDRVVALGHVQPAPEGASIERVTWLPSEVTGLRFDPTAGPGGVSIDELSLTPVDDETGLREAFAHLESHEAFVRHGLRTRIAEARQVRDLGDRAKFIPLLSEALSLYEGEALDPYFHWRIADSRKATPVGPETHSGDGPLFSILFPVFNCPEPFLDAALASVRAQLYPRWELLAVDDLSSRPHVRRVLERHQLEDSRIRVQYREKNGGISAASNDALAIAQGSFVALFDHDDVLAPEALLEMARAVRHHPQADFFYSDEDKVDAEGHRFSPFFKPDWSREYFLSCMFTCHLGVYRTQVLRDIGGFRPAFDGAQDYDLVLRLIRRTEAIVHVPRILYSWRAHRASTASAGDSKPYAHFAAERAIGEYLDGEGRWGGSSGAR